MSPHAREQAAADLAEWVYSAPFRLEYDVSVAAYVPVGTEPGSVGFLDALLDRRVTVLLPVVAPGAPGPLDWARYDGPDSLRQGRWGLLEPATECLGIGAVTAASVIFLPALAVDRGGVRLGRGAGYYDRSLATLSTDRHGRRPELVAVVYDDEVLDELPADAHDIAVGWALTPGEGFIELG